MLDICNEFGFEQIVKEPTRVNTILDLFSNSTLVERSALIPGIADHDGIPMISINTRPKAIKQKPRKVYSFHKGDVNAIKDELRVFSSNLVKHYTHQSSVHAMYSAVENKIKEVMDRYVPSRVIRKRNRTPWINNTIKRVLNKKQRAYNRWHRTRTPCSLFS